jgi:hypothetical protein
VLVHSRGPFDVLSVSSISHHSDTEHAVHSLPHRRSMTSISSPLDLERDRAWPAPSHGDRPRATHRDPAGLGVGHELKQVAGGEEACVRGGAERATNGVCAASNPARKKGATMTSGAHVIVANGVKYYVWPSF